MYQPRLVHSLRPRIASKCFRGGLHSGRKNAINKYIGGYIPSGSLGKQTKEKACESCGQIFQARKRNFVYGGYEAHCRDCVKRRVWRRAFKT